MKESESVVSSYIAIILGVAFLIPTIILGFTAFATFGATVTNVTAADTNCYNKRPCVLYCTVQLDSTRGDLELRGSDLPRPCETYEVGQRVKVYANFGSPQLMRPDEAVLFLAVTGIFAFVGVCLIGGSVASFRSNRAPRTPSAW